MKNLFLALLCCFFSIGAIAQTTQTITVKGIIIDSAINKPMGYVTVALQNPQTQQPVKSALAKDDGSFQLTAPAGHYRLALAFVGYQTKYVSLKASEGIINVGKVLLPPSSKQLKEVAVTAMKPIVKQEIDRIGYDVQADPESKAQNVLDMLRKVPLITVDANDNIQLKGESNYKILINGKPSSLVAHNPSDVFKSMPASSIEKIEVITTPPAKYDAEGLSGIINIITKKKVDQGYNGSVNVRENSLYGPGAGASLTVKEGKIGLSTYFGYSLNTHRHSSSDNELLTYVPGQTGDVETNLQQSGTNVNYGHFIYGSAELSYEIDTLNLVTASVSLDKGSFTSENDQISHQFDMMGVLNQQYNLNNNGNSSFEGFDIGINYQLGFKRNKDQLLTASYKFSHSPSSTYNDNDIFNRLNYGLPSYIQQNNSGTNEHTIQLDYVHPLKKLNIEGGVKAILRNNFSDFESSDRDSLGNYVRNPENSNDFNYEQNVYSLYNTYQYNVSNWGVKAGVRAEETTVDADFVSTGSVLNTNYVNVIPSISIQRKLKNNSSFTFGFTNRIQRPDISELNPFVNQTNPKFISTGNPDLKPVLNHSFEFNYSKFGKGNINVGINYSFANNTIQNVTRLQDTVTYTTYQNIGSDRQLALNAGIGWPIGKKINVNLNSRISEIWLRGFFNDQLYNNRGLQGYAFSYAGYRITPTLRFGVNAGFYSSGIQLQGKSSSSFFSSASLNKDVLNKKGSIFLNTNNPFAHYRRYTSYTNDPSFYQSSVSINPQRSVNIGFNYRFGKLKAEIKKNQRGIDNDDTKGKSTGGSAN